MEIAFTSRRMEKLCNSAKEMQSRLGDRNAKVLEMRLAQIKAAETLEDLMKVPGARCHELTGDRSGELAVDLVHPKRLIFEPAHDPLPRKADGGIDRNQVTQVVVIEITDYH